jgi:hypothetical protein
MAALMRTLLSELGAEFCQFGDHDALSSVQLLHRVGKILAAGHQVELNAKVFWQSPEEAYRQLGIRRRRICYALGGGLANTYVMFHAKWHIE